MPRRVSDYPDAFTGWNFISSIGSIISVAATALFLQIVYLQLVKGKAVFGYPWAVPQLFSDFLRILKDKSAPGLEWALDNPPKPHAFTSLPLQSTGGSGSGSGTSGTGYTGGTGDTGGDKDKPTPTPAPVTDPITMPAPAGALDGDMVFVKHPVTGKMVGGIVRGGRLVILSSLISILPVLIGLFSLIAGVGVILTLYNFTSDLLFLTNDSIMCDAPRAWGLYFQDSASPQMEALVELHDNIMYYLVAILFGVAWIQAAIIKNFESTKSPISNKYLNHGTLIELIWTITPALILVLIAFPSFKLLYLMDEVTDPSLSVLAEGHQWYWSYEYPDFLNSDGDFVEFDSYLVPESDLEEGSLRMLEVDNRVILPEITHTRFILTAADVIHSFAIPALGVKCDAYPGRLNQFSVLINRLGTFYGQCSEICGILHSSMPIVVESVSLVKFLSWLQEQ